MNAAPSGGSISAAGRGRLLLDGDAAQHCGAVKAATRLVLRRPRGVLALAGALQIGVRLQRR